MGRKQKHEEHENLERWLVSYADFITLLFATFVVLYALAQTDVSQFSQLDQSMRGSFSPTVFDGKQGMMDNAGENIVGEGSADSVMSMLMMEYLNPKYEQDSYEKIEQEIKEMLKNKELEGVDVKIDEKGLNIILSEKALLFQSGSAELSPQAKIQLDKIGALIGKKFILHLMRVEGHTDDLPTRTEKYPSNWELSSARACSIVRYFIERFKFSPELFTPVGYADTRPLVKNTSNSNRSMNRRVDIVVLRNKYKPIENARDSLIKMDKKEQEKVQERLQQTVNSVMGLSDAAKQLTDSESDEKKVIILKEDR